MSDNIDFAVLVNALSRLQDVTGRKADFLFPRIIAVGNQSCGKSSIIQGLIGREILPRGSDIVTRCPLNIRVHQIQVDEEYVCFSAEEKYNIPETRFTDFGKVIVEIDKRTALRTGNSKNISKEEINIDFYSSKYPDLQFVDLPGFTKTNVAGQARDIEEQVLSLVLDYMRDRNTIILAIMDSTQDIASSEALKYAERDDIDPKGERTIGVLTKLDKLEPGSDTNRAVNILDNKAKPLSLGYIGVVNRSQNQIDQNIDIEQAKELEGRVITQAAFRKMRHRMGIDYLRKFLTVILAQKMRELLPTLRKDSMEELAMVQEQLEELGANRDESEEVDTDDLISALVEKAIKDLRTILHGYTTEVDLETVSLGAKMNETIKSGVVRSSHEARTIFAVEEFHRKLETGLKNMHAARDQMMPVELVLDVGVGLLTENYRRPFKALLEESAKLLSSGIQASLENTIAVYPKFKDLVTNILMDEIFQNKFKTEEYLDTLINIHKRVLNTEHAEFKKATKRMRKNGIRFKNHTNVWFKSTESSPTPGDRTSSPSREEGSDGEDGEGFNDLAVDAGDAVIEHGAALAAAAVGGPVAGAVVGNVVGGGGLLKKVKGFLERLQNKDEDREEEIHTNKFPSSMSEEAILHLDLCLEYMEIIDKQLVDQIPKYYIMMLVHRTTDFLEGGTGYKTSLLRQVQKKLDTKEKAGDFLTKSHMHEEMVSGLRERRNICQDTIKVIEETVDNLNKCT